MTIDEAIAQENVFSIEDWSNRKKYHEQLSEWLTELKRLRSYKEDKREECKDCAGCIQWKCECSNIRNKAIDAFAELLKHEILCEISDVSESQKIYEVGSDESKTRSHIMCTLRDVNSRIIDKVTEQLKESEEW